MGNVGHSPSVSPDGSRIAYSTYRYVEGNTMYGNFIRYFEIETSALDGSNRHRLTEGMGAAGFDVSPVWSPDGSHIAFVRLADTRCIGDPRPTEIHVMKADGSDVRKIVATRSEDAKETLRGEEVTYIGGLTWSPNGQILAYVARDVFNYKRSGQAALYAVDAAGLHPTRLFPLPAAEWDSSREGGVGGGGTLRTGIQ